MRSFDAWRRRYNEFPQSEEWKSCRRKVLERNRGQCVLCGADRSTATLHWHHLIYSDDWADPQTCVILCEACRSWVHAHRVPQWHDPPPCCRLAASANIAQ
jgi:5-methylcytosine-specific restriction endonuclease McrA